jgi:phosphoglycolate phosphatase
MALCCRYEHEVLAQDECRLCYPGVVETIRTLAGQIPVCIVSNCQAGYIELFIEKTGLGDCITDTECFGNNGKSKGENIRLVAERNGFAHPAYVGDIQGDCDASREAGVSFILAAYGFGTAEDPDWKIDTFSQLLPLIREEAAGTER